VEKDEQKEKERRRFYLEISYSSLGIEFVVATLIGTLIGYWLDKRFHTQPWLLVIGTFLGAAAGMLNAWNLYQKLRERETKIK
jgi:F0F1-type ATP synthase assembly protein I